MIFGFYCQENAGNDGRVVVKKLFDYTSYDYGPGKGSTCVIKNIVPRLDVLLKLLCNTREHLD